jgi:hypothetical protein
MARGKEFVQNRGISDDINEKEKELNLTVSYEEIK